MLDSEVLDNSGPFTVHTDVERSQIEGVIGTNVDGLLEGIPPELRRPHLVGLPAALSAIEVDEEMARIGDENESLDGKISFLGAGAVRNFIPGIVAAIIGNPKFATAYTPYQPEVAQGTLQYTYELGEAFKKLFRMPLVGAGLYAGMNAAAEGARMAIRLTGKRVIGILDDVDPNMREVVTTYAEAIDTEVKVISSADPEKLDDDLACVLIQQPNFIGTIEDLESWIKVIHERNALALVSADPVFAAMTEPPGSFGADIVVGEGQSLGIDPRFGGSYYGIFSGRLEYARQFPGRLVAESVDNKNRRGYLLTLTGREQYGGREDATSNFTTAAALNGLMVAVYLAAMGEFGLKRVAELSYHRAHYAAAAISEIPMFQVLNKGDFFRSFAIRTPIPVDNLNDRLLERGIIGGLNIGKGDENIMLLTVTEVNSRRQIDTLVNELGKVAA